MPTSSQAPAIIVVMGVSGVGKTTIGQLLAQRLHRPFEDADALHTPANIDKMRRGTPLTDDDRRAWLGLVAQKIEAWQRDGRGGVIACSALKHTYRELISRGRQDVIFVYLHGDKATIADRLAARQGHFMPEHLLASQFDALEEPTLDEDAIWVPVSGTPEEIVTALLAQLETRQKEARMAATLSTTISDDPTALARALADWFVQTLRDKSGRIAVAVAGGSTPKAFYQCLAAPPYQAQVPWSRVHWFFGDERFVPPTSASSNYRMFAEAIAAERFVPPENLHAIPTAEVSAARAAALYEEELRSFYGADRLNPDRPFFDVTLLGLGTDGHTASLFPGSTALDERQTWVLPSVAPDGSTRITLTYPLLESSAQTAFLVAGAEKQPILAQFLAGDRALPAARLSPHGLVRLFADRAAYPGGSAPH
ncbi:MULTISPECIES: 6-phosphogluconolactonase [unclassified Beijerinckia]|uniref:6-phosphogluconolactonase n=1 Tax=unclassified Beijerinckia TaxID=2638183 RepID=UPI000899B04E|nr:MULTISPECIES: 6-phosphogluconolactonase [unclassified Beijerinckia]MDH7796065.1 6-phosphogluconolactonase [Beijerinckia sp. GAS462]SEC28734.1 6-phosphogluconolactonase [Beijerinckia sp. 28-YEA-48]